MRSGPKVPTCQGPRHGRESRGARVTGGGVVGTPPPSVQPGFPPQPEGSAGNPDRGILKSARNHHAAQFRWPGANYDRDCALGREQPFLADGNG